MYLERRIKYPFACIQTLLADADLRLQLRIFGLAASPSWSCRGGSAPLAVPLLPSLPSHSFCLAIMNARIARGDALARWIVAVLPLTGRTRYRMAVRKAPDSTALAQALKATASEKQMTMLERATAHVSISSQDLVCLTYTSTGVGWSLTSFRR
jgi:hypothetical protein